MMSARSLNPSQEDIGNRLSGSMSFGPPISRRCAIMPNDAIASTLPLGSVGCEADPDEKGQRLISVEATVLERLRTMRRPGETYSDVILRLVEIEAKGRR